VCGVKQDDGGVGEDLNMRNGHRWRRALLGLTLLTQVACGHSSTAATPTQPSPTITSVAVTSAGRFTAIGQAVQFTATATSSTGGTENVTAQAVWLSSNAQVITISAAGVATSVAEGDARISATYQSVLGSSDVSVRVLWIVQGRVVSNPDGGGVPGARVVTEDGQAATADSSGEFALEGPGTPASRRVTMSADGFVTRSVTLRTNEPRAGMLLDLIAQRSPFSLTFFQEIARAAEDTRWAALLPILRWESNPSFYIKTTNQSSVDLSAGVIDELRAIIPAIVSQVSGGKLSVVAIEAGREARPITAGWINVEFTTEITSCGQGSVGGNYLKINPICSCYANIEAHEIAHVLGLWHHSTRGGLMSHVAPTYCGTTLSDLEAYHAHIVYSRARGNTDPDNDPVDAVLANPADMAMERVVSCWPIDR
jgi:hypothetical protein